MRTQQVAYYLKSEEGKQYVPTKKEMEIIIPEIQGTCQYTIGGGCTIVSIKKNILVFNCEDRVFNDYGEKILLDPDDDGNYYVKRKNKSGKPLILGWYAKIYTRKKRNKKRYTQKR